MHIDAEGLGALARALRRVLAEHPRRSDVDALLVELDPEDVDYARRTGEVPIEVVCADAAMTDVYVHRLVVPPKPFRSGVRVFTFHDDSDPTQW